MRRNKTLAVLLSAVMVLGVAVPAMAGSAAAAEGSLSVGVSQDSSGATVTVTETVNNTTSAVENASVTVEVTDENATYAGTGSYTTDANGTVSLPAPNETVNVSVVASAGNLSASTSATLTASTSDDNDTNDSTDEENETTAFGDRVSSFVHALQGNSTGNVSGNGTAATLLQQTDDAENMGVLVASFVTATNPGNAPDHAGPPAWMTDDSVNKTSGPPEDAGAQGNHSGGPPEDAGNGNGGGPPEGAGNGNGNGGGGPPDHAGPPGDDDTTDDTNSTDD